ncbi:MAG: sugar ABC transporter substrate-binding protein [Leptolyngbya sp. PLA1]|nr:sugar ABC transporter substrate-binding protein [Leptolyngbya sp. PLA1]
MSGVLLLLACVAGCERSPGKPAGAAGNPPVRIAVIPKGTTHEFWQSVHAGAKQAGAARGAEVTFRGPEREDDREQQISLLQNTIASRPAAIVLAPLDHAALVGPVRDATRAGIPVVIIDSGLDATPGVDYVAMVATDNTNAGWLAGEHLRTLLPGGGKVLVLRYLEGSQSTTQREDGCIAALRAGPGIEVIDPGRFAGATRAQAQEAAENLIAATPSFDAVFCPNEPTTFGMLLALKSRGLAGRVKFVGFDSSEAAIEGMRQGHVQGIVVQNPIRMGRLGVESALDHLAGKPVSPEIDTGAMLVTPSNMDSQEARDLLSPNLRALLGG